MYKHFKKSLESASSETDKILTRSLTNLSVVNGQSDKKDETKDIQAGLEADQADPDVLRTVETCWRKIHSQCLNYASERRYPEFVDDGSWKTVRVFVSSTFTDFFCEREILVKKVFPELREWCQQRKLYLIECDLRWGVPTDVTKGQVIAACLEEIDRCHAETGGQPFFLNMLGSRYGWIPNMTDISEEVNRKYDWVENTSITFMEILHGAYRLRNNNALFMVRDDNIIKDIPDDHLARFKDSDQLSELHLKELQSKLRERFPDQVFDYTCKVEGVISKHDKKIVNITNLEAFAQHVLQFFKKTIEKFYTNRLATEDTESIIQSENTAQQQMMEETAGLLMGRYHDAQKLQSFVIGNTDNFQQGAMTKPFSREVQFWEGLDTNSQILCVQAAQGYGKTTLLAWTTHQTIKQGLSVFYHFCGGTQFSNSVIILLQRLVAFLKKDFTTDMLTSLLEKKESELRAIIKEELIKFAQLGESHHMVIVLDALDQLDTKDSVHHLSWLPPGFPTNVSCIVSTSLHPATVCRIQEHPHWTLEMETLTREDARQIIHTFLLTYNKTLEEDQMELMLNSRCSQSPLWLYFLCEELRVYGDFRSLTKHVRTVTESPEAMLESILHRLISDDDTGFMEKTLCVLGCQASVMSALDLQRMLGSIPEKVPIPLLTWLKIRRSLQAFLKIARYNDQVSFSHNMIKQVVYATLIKNVAGTKPYIRLLADYLEMWSDDVQLKIRDLPNYLTQANLKQRLVNYLRKAPETSKMPSFVRSKWFKSCRCPSLADPVITQVTPILICQFCKMSKAIYYPNSFHRNQDMCVVCGNNTFPTHNAVEAHLCAFHGIHGRTGPKKCFLCGKIAQNFIPGRLCLHCGFGNYGKQCAALKLK